MGTAPADGLAAAVRAAAAVGAGAGAVDEEGDIVVGAQVANGEDILFDRDAGERIDGGVRLAVGLVVELEPAGVV